MNPTGKRKKKQKGGEFNKKNDVHIAEATRIKIQTLLQDFRTSNHKGKVFYLFMHIGFLFLRSLFLI